jgi:hypothetical protein
MIVRETYKNERCQQVSFFLSDKFTDNVENRKG